MKSRGPEIGELTKYIEFGSANGDEPASTYAVVALGANIDAGRLLADCIEQKIRAVDKLIAAYPEATYDDSYNLTLWAKDFKDYLASRGIAHETWSIEERGREDVKALYCEQSSAYRVESWSSERGDAHVYIANPDRWYTPIDFVEVIPEPGSGKRIRCEGHRVNELVAAAIDSGDPFESDPLGL